MSTIRMIIIYEDSERLYNDHICDKVKARRCTSLQGIFQRENTN